AVGDPGAGREHGKTRAALQLRHCFGGKDGRLLMPDVDDAHAGLVRRIVDREDVATGEREEFPYAERSQTGEGELTSMSLDRSSMPLDRSSVSLDRLG